MQNKTSYHHLFNFLQFQYILDAQGKLCKIQQTANINYIIDIMTPNKRDDSDFFQYI